MALLTIGSQIIVLFALLALGYFLIRFGVVSEKGVGELTKVLCYVVSPCLIFDTFQRPFSMSLMMQFSIAVVSAVGIHVLSIGVGKIMFNSRTIKDTEKTGVLRFSSTYSNCGFMGFPLLQTAAGSQGVLLGAAYVAIFNLFNWTHGISIFTGRSNRKALAKALLNPNLIALAASIPCFYFSIGLPTPVKNSISYVADMNTALSMIVVGTQLTKVNLSSLFNDRLVWLGVFLRNLAMPLFLLMVLYGAGMRGTLLIGCVLPVACPVASFTVIFTELVGKHTGFSVKMVALSTLMCVVTIPLVVAITSVLS